MTQHLSSHSFLSPFLLPDLGIFLLERRWWNHPASFTDLTDFPSVSLFCSHFFVTSVQFICFLSLDFYIFQFLFQIWKSLSFIFRCSIWREQKNKTNKQKARKVAQFSTVVLTVWDSVSPHQLNQNSGGGPRTHSLSLLSTYIHIHMYVCKYIVINK